MSNLNIEPLNLLLKDVSSGASNLFDALQEADDSLLIRTTK